MKIEVVIHHLEMTSPGELVPAARKPEFDLRLAEEPSPDLNRFFYAAIGRNWHWIDRLRWTDEQWLTYLDRPELHTWVAYIGGNPIGYAELEQQRGGVDVEIVYFGLLDQFAGRGHGGPFLTEVIRLGWALAPERVWVHTCTLDHPAALANYEKRGFRRFDRHVTYQEI